MTNPAPPVKKAPLGALTPKDPPHLERIEARAEPNATWREHHDGKLLTVPAKPIFDLGDQFFVIGSCFAERIRMAMVDQGAKVGPAYKAIPMAPDRYQIDTLPARPHMNYYNTFAIRQEFERHAGEWVQDPGDYWTLPKDFIWKGDQPIYQDPYRRLVFGRTPEDLSEALGHVNRIMDEGIRNARVFFMTMGIGEIFVNKATGRVACQRPAYGGGGGEDETQFRMSTVAENLANMTKVMEIINRVRPDAQVIATVSPVGLARTFSGEDVVTANSYGKSMLRTVLGELAMTYDNFTYFPSYEMAKENGPNAFYESDGRHVNPWLIKNIVKVFMDAYQKR